MTDAEWTAWNAWSRFIATYQKRQPKLPRATGGHENPVPALGAGSSDRGRPSAKQRR